LNLVGIASLLLAFSPSGEPDAVRVDLVEVNHYYDEDGRKLLDQAIFFDWCEATNRYQVREWRLLRTTEEFPRLAPNGTYATRVGRDSIVVAKRYRETWSQYDPELIERKYLAREDRKPLYR
jgi:hypothetical protein